MSQLLLKYINVVNIPWSLNHSRTMVLMNFTVLLIIISWAINCPCQAINPIISFGVDIYRSHHHHQIPCHPPIMDIIICSSNWWTAGQGVIKAATTTADCSLMDHESEYGATTLCRDGVEERLNVQRKTSLIKVHRGHFTIIGPHRDALLTPPRHSG